MLKFFQVGISSIALSLLVLPSAPGAAARTSLHAAPVRLAAASPRVHIAPSSAHNPYYHRPVFATRRVWHPRYPEGFGAEYVEPTLPEAPDLTEFWSYWPAPDEAPPRSLAADPPPHRVVLFPVTISHEYHPHWTVDVW
jgi:hypothetical protein